MKNIEVKNINIGSLFKTIMYMLIIPLSILILIGIFMFIIGIIMQEIAIAIMGAVLVIGYPVLFVGIYGGIGSLVGLLYNACAQKFGGLKLSIDVSDEDNVL